MLISILLSFSLTLLRSNFEIFLIGISVNFFISSTDTSLLRFFLKGSKPKSIVDIN